MGALSILVDGMLPSTSTRSPDGTAIHCCFAFVETGIGGGEGGGVALWLSREHFDWLLSVTSFETHGCSSAWFKIWFSC